MCGVSSSTRAGFTSRRASDASTVTDRHRRRLHLWADAERRIIGHFGIQRDVTEEVRLQAEVARHAQSSRRVVEHAECAKREPDPRDRQRPARYGLRARRRRRLRGERREGQERCGKTAGRAPRARRDVEAAAASLVEVVRKTIETGGCRCSSIRGGPDGTRWFEAGAARIDGAEGKAVVVLRAHTDRKRADELERERVPCARLSTPTSTSARSSSARRRCRRSSGHRVVAETDSSVLLLGETGTGKELIARAIHRSSRRKAAVMVKVNCGACLQPWSRASSLDMSAGRSPARCSRKGRFERDRGTIFLDEVALPLDVQVKLLRVL